MAIAKIILMLIKALKGLYSVVVGVSILLSIFPRRAYVYNAERNRRHTWRIWQTQ